MIEEYKNLIFGIVGYKIFWKNDIEKEKILKVTLKEGLQVMKQWAQGEKVIFLKGSAYSTAMISSVEPRKAMCNPGGSSYPLMKGTEIERKLSQMLANGEAMTSEDASKKLKELLTGQDTGLKQLN